MPNLLQTPAAAGPVTRTGLVLEAGRPADVVAFEVAVVSFFIDAAEMLGVPKSVAAIYGICFAAPEPLSFADIEARLDISKGSISQGLRVLRDVGALKVTTKVDDRREYFAPDLELRKLIQRWLDGRLQKQLEAGNGRLQDLVRTIPGGRSASAKVIRGRLESLQHWHNKGTALVPFVRTFLKLG